MIPIGDEYSYFIVHGKTDMRKGIDTLAILIHQDFHLDPFDGSYYLFCGNRNDRYKTLHWDGQGFRLLYKRFENGKLQWPRAKTPWIEAVSAEEIERFLSGFPLKASIQNSDKKILIYPFLKMMKWIILILFRREVPQCHKDYLTIN